MKHLKQKGSGFALAFILLVIAALAAIWYGVADTFYSFTGSDFRSMWAASLFVVATVWFVLANLRADDRRTSELSRSLAIVFFGFAIVMFVAKNIYEQVGGDLSQVSDLIVWAIPATWALPVVVGVLFFTLESLDIYWGEDKQYIPNRDQSTFVNTAYKFLYGVGILAALIGSAIGTYEVAYAFTNSQWHALAYVGTIEVAIYVGTRWTHTTNDRTMFWYLFGMTLAIFSLALSFQILDSLLKASGTAEAMEVQFGYLARQFVFLPPILVGAAFIYLYQFNQRKEPEPFKAVPQGKQAQQPKPSSGGDNRGSFTDKQQANTAPKGASEPASFRPPSDNGNKHEPEGASSPK